jgi:DNA-binding NarL/FixJ family response regulator
MATLRVFIAEDHLMVREGLKALINAQADMDIVGEAGDGLNAVIQTRELQPDVVIIDVSMPVMNGQKATAKIIEACPQVKILALTRHTDTGFIQQLFRAGVSGYVLKQSASAKLIEAIHTVIAGNHYIDPAITGKVINSYTNRQIKLDRSSQNSLSDREEEVIKMVAWGYSNKEIAARLDISIKTVEAHKANSMKKLDLRSRIDVVRYALLQGWLTDN